MIPTALLASVCTHLTETEPVKGESIYSYDSHGNRYMGFISGIKVINAAHCHQKIDAAIQEQNKRLLFDR